MKISRNFFIYLQGRSTTALINAFISMAILYWFVNVLDNPVLMGIYSFTITAPTLFFALLAGPIADTVSKKKIIVNCDVINGFFGIAIGLLFYFIKNTYLVFIILIIIANAKSIIGQLFDSALMSAFPLMVRKEDLIQANSLKSTVSSITSIVSSSVKGFIVAMLNLPYLFFIQGGVLFFSAFTETFFKFKDPALENKKEKEPPAIREEKENIPENGKDGNCCAEKTGRQAKNKKMKQWLYAMKQGFFYIKKDKTLLTLFFIIGTQTIFWGLFMPTFAFYFMKDLGFSAGLYGIFFALLQGGCILGNSIALLLSKKKYYVNLFIALIFLSNILIPVIGFLKNAWLILGAGFFFGFLGQNNSVVIESIVQHKVDEKYYGRVLSVFDFFRYDLEFIGRSLITVFFLIFRNYQSILIIAGVLYYAASIAVVLVAGTKKYITRAILEINR